MTEVWRHEERKGGKYSGQGEDLGVKIMVSELSLFNSRKFVASQVCMSLGQAANDWYKSPGFTET